MKVSLQYYKLAAVLSGLRKQHLFRRFIMGGEREIVVEKKEPKSKVAKADIGGFRIHQKDGEIHVHDDANKVKVVIPVVSWWKMWDRLRNEIGTWTYVDPHFKTKLVIETTIDQLVIDVKIAVIPMTFGDSWSKIDTFTKKK